MEGFGIIWVATNWTRLVEPRANCANMQTVQLVQTMQTFAPPGRGCRTTVRAPFFVSHSGLWIRWEPPILTLCGEIIPQTVRLQAEPLKTLALSSRDFLSSLGINHHSKLSTTGWHTSYLGSDFSQPPAPGSNIPISPAAGKQSDYVTLMLLQDIGSARVIIIIRD